jgi:hypothetical protein
MMCAALSCLRHPSQLKDPSRKAPPRMWDMATTGIANGSSLPLTGRAALRFDSTHSAPKVSIDAPTQCHVTGRN